MNANDKKKQQTEQMLKQFDAVKEILAGVEYDNCTDVYTYYQKSDIVVNYITTKGWHVTATVRDDATITFNFAKNDCKPGYTKTCYYDVNIDRYEHLSVFEHWVSWYYHDDNGNKITSEVVVND